MSTFGLPDRRAQLNAERERLEARLSERVTQEIRLAINHRTDPSYSPILDVVRPRGFGEVSEARFSIVTPARKRLQFLLNNLSGASIGIAGSRGAGKTTLIRNFCGPKRIFNELNGKPILGVLVSAPVAYQARDFLLYLFSTACQNVIEAEGGHFAAPAIAEVFEPDRELRNLPELRRLPIALVQFGTVLVALGLVASLLVATLAGSGPVSKNAEGTAPATKPATVASKGSAQLPLPAAAPETQDGGASAPTPTNAPHQQTSEPPDTFESGLVMFGHQWIEAIKADPGKSTLVGRYSCRPGVDGQRDRLSERSVGALLRLADARFSISTGGASCEGPTVGGRPTEEATQPPDAIGARAY